MKYRYVADDPSCDQAKNFKIHILYIYIYSVQENLELWTDNIHSACI